MKLSSWFRPKLTNNEKMSDNATFQNPIYAAFVDSELKVERDRKSALDSRGGGLVTSSGAIVAVLVGIGSIGQGASRAGISETLIPLLVLALTAFVAAAVAGIVAQWNREYEVTSIAGIRLLLNQRWRDSPGDSMRQVGADQLQAFISLRSKNRQKEVALRWGYGFQVLAIMLLSPIAFSMIFTR